MPGRHECFWQEDPSTYRPRHRLELLGIDHSPRLVERSARFRRHISADIILSRHQTVLGRNARSLDCDQAVHFALWATLTPASYLKAS